MPYVTQCLRSLVRQTIGLGRMEVIAVNDGSTDDSPQELARFAARYPSVFTVVNQANSGGPAAPSNRGLALARGRYVFFVGSDDYLGPEALERLVAAADEYDADVVAGRMVGVGGRYVPQTIFTETNTDVDLYNSELPFAVSNTKLFRRELLETHAIRYPEDLRMGSDQPFTVAALVNAKRIVALGDYDYYFAVKRLNRSNITFNSTHELRLACTRRIMDLNAGLLESGPRRDAILLRSFASEIAKLTRGDFLKLDRSIQERLVKGIGELADTYLTENIRMRLDVPRRARISLAQRGMVDEVIATVRHNVGKAAFSFVRDETGLYANFPFFRDERGLPDAWYFVTDDPSEMMVYDLTINSIVWESLAGNDSLIVRATSPFTVAELQAADLTAIIANELGSAGMRGTVSRLRAAVKLNAGTSPDGATSTTVEFRWAMRGLTALAPRLGGRFDVIAQTTVDGRVFRTQLRLPGRVKRPIRFLRVGLRAYLVRPVKQSDREFALEFRAATRAEIRGNIEHRLKSKAKDLVRRARRLMPRPSAPAK